MKTCSLNDFMQELAPWLDNDHIRHAAMDEQGRLVIQFTDLTRHVYLIDDCTRSRVDQVLTELAAKGIKVER